MTYPDLQEALRGAPRRWLVTAAATGFIATGHRRRGSRRTGAPLER
ncbi:MAG TPA: hypothetical protein VK002_13180 [Rubricoccaceae bacterium]|nr:hypothetical protein [Rubricoccaceae bacterium]